LIEGGWIGVAGRLTGVCATKMGRCKNVHQVFHGDLESIFREVKNYRTMPPTISGFLFPPMMDFEVGPARKPQH
jgi:hypothetical protein